MTAKQQRTSARSAAKQRSVRITITTTPQVKAYLESLVSLGLYGTSVADAANQIICDGLRNDLRRRRTALFEPPKPNKETP